MGTKAIRRTTSIKIYPEIWEQARIYAIKKKMTFSELIETLIYRELKEKTLKTGK